MRTIITLAAPIALLCSALLVGLAQANDKIRNNLELFCTINAENAVYMFDPKVGPERIMPDKKDMPLSIHIYHSKDTTTKEHNASINIGQFNLVGNKNATVDMYSLMSYFNVTSSFATNLRSRRSGVYVGDVGTRHEAIKFDGAKLTRNKIETNIVSVSRSKIPDKWTGVFAEVDSEHDQSEVKYAFFTCQGSHRDYENLYSAIVRSQKEWDDALR